MSTFEPGPAATPSAVVGAGRSSRAAAFAMIVYGALAYVLFVFVFLYAIGWVEGLVVPRTIDDGAQVSATLSLVTDLVLLSVFAVQHSVMARPAFKRRWTRIVPVPIERSTFVLFASAVLALLMWQWRPLPSEVWDVGPTPARVALYAISLSGWALVLTATFAIDHFDLFGLRQVLRHAAGKPPAAPEFRTPTVYRTVRHPLYLGFLIAFWAAPTMTVGRLLFAIVTTAYILTAIRFEEHDLVGTFGDDYRRYRQRVPMLLIHPRRKT